MGNMNQMLSRMFNFEKSLSGIMNWNETSESALRLISNRSTSKQAICQRHKRPIEMICIYEFCSSDERFACSICSMTYHQSHEQVPLEEFIDDLLEFIKQRRESREEEATQQEQQNKCSLHKRVMQYYNWLNEKKETSMLGQLQEQLQSVEPLTELYIMDCISNNINALVSKVESLMTKKDTSYLANKQLCEFQQNFANCIKKFLTSRQNAEAKRYFLQHDLVNSISNRIPTITHSCELPSSSAAAAAAEGSSCSTSSERHLSMNNTSGQSEEQEGIKINEQKKKYLNPFSAAKVLENPKVRTNNALTERRSRFLFSRQQNCYMITLNDQEMLVLIEKENKTLQIKFFNLVENEFKNADTWYHTQNLFETSDLDDFSELLDESDESPRQQLRFDRPHVYLNLRHQQSPEHRYEYGQGSLFQYPQTLLEQHTLETREAVRDNNYHVSQSPLFQSLNEEIIESIANTTNENELPNPLSRIERGNNGISSIDQIFVSNAGNDIDRVNREQEPQETAERERQFPQIQVLDNDRSREEAEEAEESIEEVGRVIREESQFIIPEIPSNTLRSSLRLFDYYLAQNVGELNLEPRYSDFSIFNLPNDFYNPTYPIYPSTNQIRRINSNTILHLNHTSIKIKKLTDHPCTNITTTCSSSNNYINDIGGFSNIYHNIHNESIQQTPRTDSNNIFETVKQIRLSTSSIMDLFMVSPSILCICESARKQQLLFYNINSMKLIKTDSNFSFMKKKVQPIWLGKQGTKIAYISNLEFIIVDWVTMKKIYSAQYSQDSDFNSLCSFVEFYYNIYDEFPKKDFKNDLKHKILFSANFAENRLQYCIPVLNKKINYKDEIEIGYLQNRIFKTIPLSLSAEKIDLKYGISSMKIHNDTLIILLPNGEIHQIK